MSGHYRKEKNCLNCGHQVESHYCSQCGQPNLELKEPFFDFVTHSVGHYFHFDAKFWKTLVPLLTKPGQVTLDYLAGKRARYIHPVSLYIFVSIVYFLIVPHALEKKKSTRHVPTIAEKNEGLRKATKALEGVDDDEAQSIHEHVVRDEFKSLSFASQAIHLDSLNKVNAAKPNDSLKRMISRLSEIHIDRADSSLAAYKARQAALPAKERDSWYKQYIKKWIYDKEGNRKDDPTVLRTAEDREAHLQEEVKKYAPKQYFLLMPLLALFIMINFRKNKIYYVDHLVFTIHGMTAYFIVSIVTQPMKKYIFGLDSWLSTAITMLVGIGILWYLYAGLKLFYQRSTWVTVRKTIMVTLLYAIAYSLSEGMIEMIVSSMM
jgi:hypothetical protein